MKFKAIVIDANILIKNYALTSHYLHKLVKTRKFYELDIFIPEVVFDECIGNYEESLTDAKEKLDRIYKSFDLLGLNGILNKNSAAKKLDNSHKKYPARLNKFIKENNITILPYPSVKHKHIVERMNQRIKPFTDKNVKEKGYKDYLIVESIKELIKDKKNYKVIFITENLNDFACSNEISKIGRDNLLSLDSHYEAPNVYVARTTAVSFRELSSNIPKTCSADVIKKFDATLIKHMKKCIIEQSAALSHDLFSSFLNIEIDEKSISCDVVESNVNIDNETDILEAKGIIKISLSCSFSVDNVDLQIKFIDDKFYFIDKVRDRIHQNRLPLRGEWCETFTDEKFSTEFLFECVQFDHIKDPHNSQIYIDIFRL
ncbi:PIN domain-containing protein [Pseudomonas sp. 21LCFQ02]|uniref:PIN domain-containing protein n=1 Tax=Pseudomonas sp. 21LCFQ02 TaxID=2957505 RepID=UPI00209B3D13|nr:PIN domain-containing protein [Pseudomonas sp. 21LCFQ02]MCO8166237.1 PIN domain-containing protein [Pseudomonas sp. 21LCFQ02]